MQRPRLPAPARGSSSGLHWAPRRACVSDSGDAMKKLKVALVTAFPADPAAPRGGVEAVSVNLVEALARFGDLDVQVVTTDVGRQEPSAYMWRGATIHRLPQRGSRVLTDAIGPGR